MGWPRVLLTPMCFEPREHCGHREEASDSGRRRVGTGRMPIISIGAGTRDDL